MRLKEKDGCHLREFATTS